jgi:uncharacterized protein YbaR (Trm112 family)
MRNRLCPSCRNPLKAVTQSENSMLNEEQFNAVRAGDYYCDICPSNGRGDTEYKYYWENELPVILKLKDEFILDHITHEMNCAQCKHWGEYDDAPTNIEIGRCNRTKLFWDETEWNSMGQRVLINDQDKAFTQDGSDYSAYLLTRACFSCVQFERKTPEDEQS